MVKYSLFLAVFMISLLSCKQKDDKIVPETLPEDFEVFYNEFHADSLFQISHIQFPLEGSTSANDQNIDLMIPVKWERENWIMHKPFNDHNQTFQRNFYEIGSVIVEKISDQQRFFSMERRFAKMDKEWYLIYYSVTK